MMNLIAMLRELDVEKNSKEDIKHVLNYIANEFEKIIYGEGQYEENK